MAQRGGEPLVGSEDGELGVTLLRCAPSSPWQQRADPQFYLAGRLASRGLFLPIETQRTSVTQRDVSGFFENLEALSRFRRLRGARARLRYVREHKKN